MILTHHTSISRLGAQRTHCIQQTRNNRVYVLLFLQHYNTIQLAKSNHISLLYYFSYYTSSSLDHLSSLVSNSTLLLLFYPAQSHKSA